MRNRLFRRRGSFPGQYVESRVKCACELCALSHGRLLYPKRSGEALRLRRIPGFTTNFPLTKPHWRPRRILRYWHRP